MRSLTMLVALALGACSQSKPAPPPPIQFARASPTDLAHGERIAAVLGCSGCHGKDLTGEDWSEPGFGTLWIANLTRAVPAYSDAQLSRVIRSGAKPGRELWGMPSHLFTQLTDADMAALILFLRSRPPRGVVHPDPSFEEGARREIAAGMFMSSRAEVAKEGKAWPPDAGVEHALGRYIVRATCAECHGIDLRGGQPNPGQKMRPDLRIAAAYEPGQFLHLLRTGKAVGEREVGLMSEVARGRYKRLTDGEIGAVHAYLRKVAEIAP